MRPFIPLIMPDCRAGTTSAVPRRREMNCIGFALFFGVVASASSALAGINNYWGFQTPDYGILGQVTSFEATPTQQMITGVQLTFPQQFDTANMTLQFGGPFETGAPYVLTLGNGGG